jgi:hypothetical protein
MKKQDGLKIVDLFLNPQYFFKSLYEDNDYRKHALFLVKISVLFVIVWFGRILYLILNPNHFNEEIALYTELFKVLDIKALGIISLFFILDTIVLFIYVFIIAFLSNLISRIFKVHLQFAAYWKIACYTTALIVPLGIVQLLLDMTLLSKFYAIAAAAISIYGLALLILGIKVFKKRQNVKYGKIGDVSAKTKKS